MMNLPLWYFILHFVVFGPAVTIKSSSKAYHYRTKGQCESMLNAVKTEIRNMAIKPEKGVAKAYMTSKCMQADIPERGLKRDPSKRLHVLGPDFIPIRGWTGFPA